MKLLVNNNILRIRPGSCAMPLPRVFLAISVFLTPAAFAAGARKIPPPSGLPTAVASEIIRVKDGDSIDLTEGFVRDKIGKRWITRLAYNGMIPGPMIVAPKGAKIKLKLINKTGEPTSLHSHGLRVDDKNDGVVGIGQEPILDGASHVYDLKFPDAGLFWYHPHMSDEYGQEMGLQGNYWVVDSDLSQLPKVDREEVLVIDDLLVEDGKLPGFKEGTLSYALMGRYGSINLVNNKAAWTTKARQDDVIRFWLTNTANARPFKLRFTGTQMKLVGADGGLYTKDSLVDEIVLAPSERAVVDVLFKEKGVSRLENIGPKVKQILGRVTVGAKSRLASPHPPFNSLMERPAIMAEIKPLLALRDAKPDYTMKIDATLRGQHADHVMSGSMGSDGIEWEDPMPGMSEDMTDKDVSWRVIDADTGKENMDINWIFTRNKPVKIRIVNDGKHHPMQHPMHFHGQRFVVLSRNDKPESNWVYKDTVLVPAGQSVEVVLDNQNPGRWMGHCHISEHLGTGMMFGFEVR